MTAHIKNVGGVEYRTTKLGALRQLHLLPTILRWLSGPVGVAVELMVKNGDAVKTVAAKVADQAAKRKAGDTLSPGITIADLKDLNLAIDPAALSGLLVGLAAEIEDGGEAALLNLFADTHVVISGKPLELGNQTVFDSTFNGDFRTLAIVAAWVVGVNYADFLNSGTSGAAVSGTQPRSNARSPRASKR